MSRSTGSQTAARPSPLTAQKLRHDPLTLISALDQLTLIGGGLIFYMLMAGTMQVPLPILAAIAIGAGIFAITAYARQLYSYTRMESIVRQLMPFTFTFFQYSVCVSTFLLVARMSDPQTLLWLGVWATTSMLIMAAARLTFWMAWARPERAALYARKVILVGASEKAALMIRHFLQHKGHYDIIGLFITDDDSSASSQRIIESFSHIPLMSTIEDLTSYCTLNQVDDIIITPELEYTPDGETVLKALEVLPCSIKYCIPGNFFSRPLADVELISHIPVVTIFNTPLKGTSLVLKRAEDILISSVALLVSAPALLLITALVALDGKGHILFRQKRHGFGGAEFDIYKFRSMTVAASHGEVVQATRDDKRVTWIGKFLRRTSLDELPQLFNVLKGDMSIVGPRPHAIMHNYYYKELINGYVARQRIKPGITGWAQVNGWRGETDTIEKMRKRVEHDLYYVENWSLWFDIKIIVLTAFTFMLQKNAY